MKRSDYHAIIKAITDFENKFKAVSIKSATVDCDHCKGHGSVDLYDNIKGDLLAVVDCKNCEGSGEIKTDESTEPFFSRSGCSICNISENEAGGAGDVYDCTFLAKEDCEKKIFDNIHEDQICGCCLSIIVNGDVSGLDYYVDDENCMEDPKLVYLDCCLPDYFQGHKNKVFVAYPDNKTTINEVFSMIEDDAQCQELEKEFCGFNWSDFGRALDRAKKENKDSLDKPCFPDLPDIDHEDDSIDCESVVAYFTVIDEV